MDNCRCVVIPLDLKRLDLFPVLAPGIAGSIAGKKLAKMFREANDLAISISSDTIHSPDDILKKAFGISQTSRLSVLDVLKDTQFKARFGELNP